MKFFTTLAIVLIITLFLSFYVVAQQPEVASDSASSPAFHPMMKVQNTAPIRAFVVPHLDKDQVVDILNDNEHITRRMYCGCIEKQCQKSKTKQDKASSSAAQQTAVLDSLFRNAVAVSTMHSYGYKLMSQQLQVGAIVERALKVSGVVPSAEYMMFIVEQRFGRFVAIVLQNDDYVSYDNISMMYGDAVFIALRQNPQKQQQSNAAKN